MCQVGIRCYSTHRECIRIIRRVFRCGPPMALAADDSGRHTAIACGKTRAFADVSDRCYVLASALAPGPSGLGTMCAKIYETASRLNFRATCSPTRARAVALLPRPLRALTSSGSGRPKATYLNKRRDAVSSGLEFTARVSRLPPRKTLIDDEDQPVAMVDGGPSAVAGPQLRICTMNIEFHPPVTARRRQFASVAAYFGRAHVKRVTRPRRGR
jgi:hypothetical protein